MFGAIHKESYTFELYPYGQILNSDLYCQQLECLKKAIAQKPLALANRRVIVFRLDNARLHISIVTRQKQQELGYEVSLNSSYNVDQAPSVLPVPACVELFC